MTEDPAAIGIVASVTRIADFSSSIARRLDEFYRSDGEVPESLLEIQAELLVLRALLPQAAETHTSISANALASRALRDAIQDCSDQMSELETSLAEALSLPGSNWNTRSRKAIFSLHHEVRVRIVTKSVRSFSRILASYHAAFPSTESSNTLHHAPSPQSAKRTCPVSRNEDIEDLRRRCNDLEAQVYEQSLRLHLPQTDSKLQLQSHVCFTLATVVLLIFSISLTLALWWSIAHHDCSGGFTMGAYIIATAGLPIGVFGYRHSHNCRCWVKLQEDAAQPQLLADNGRSEGTEERDDIQGDSRESENLDLQDQSGVDGVELRVMERG